MREPTSPAPLAERVSRRVVAPGTLGAWWLGGSGFIFKTPSNRQIWIDPYLSDRVRTMFGLGRVFPAPISAAEAEPDIVVSTHWHEDHLDPGCIPEIAHRHPTAQFVMPPSTMAHAVHLGLVPAQITTLVHGQVREFGDVRLTAVIARHEAGVPGWEVPDAIGVIIETEGLCIYHSGDTDYDPRVHRAVGGMPLTLATLCINGSVGNMNAHEAALLAWQLNVKSLVPHHHLLWDRSPENIPAFETLDPRAFAATYRNLGGTAQVILPEVGGDMTINTKGLSTP